MREPERKSMRWCGKEREGIRIFWFSTNTSSNKVKCFRDNPKASIYFMDRRYFRGASLSGTVEVLEDPEVKERLWLVYQNVMGMI